MSLSEVNVIVERGYLLNLELDVGSFCVFLLTLFPPILTPTKESYINSLGRVLRGYHVSPQLEPTLPLRSLRTTL